MSASHKSQTVRPAAIKCTKAFEGLAQFTSLAFMAAHKDKDFMQDCMTYDGKDSLKKPFQNLFLVYYTKCMYLTKFMLNSFTLFTRFSQPWLPCSVHQGQTIQSGCKHHESRVSTFRCSLRSYVRRLQALRRA